MILIGGVVGAVSEAAKTLIGSKSTLAYRNFSKLCLIGLLVLTQVFASLSLALAGDFPVRPDAALTPGDLCKHPSEYRYPERIPYCRRNVDTSEKWQVIRAYNQKFGYNIDASNRDQFKIDHFIPLCAGGSNESTNLWPQHVSVYQITDPIEQVMCEKMAQGKLRQRDAVTLIFRAKNDLNQAGQVLAYIQRL